MTAEYMFEGYTGLAAEVAPAMPDGDVERVAYMAGLVIPPLESGSDAEVIRAVFEEAPAVAGILQEAGVPPNRSILMHDSNSLRIANAPEAGWFVSAVKGPAYHSVEDPTNPRRDPPNPLLLSQEGRLYVYYTGQPQTEPSVDGVLRNWYVPQIPGTADPENARAALLGYALLVTQPEVPAAS